MTLKVFLVDDEIAIREGIRNAPLWEKGDFTLVGEACDGEMALPMIQDEQPDILITDIRMPFMDGMQLAEEINRQMPWIEMIILSGYDDFAYARKAMSLGVQEYLLKPISSADLREALEKAAARIGVEKQRRESMEQLRRRVAYGNRFLKEKLLKSVLTESTDMQSAQKLLEQLHTMGMHLAAKRYQVVDLYFDEPAMKMEAGQEIVHDLAERSGGAILTCASRHGALALVLGDSDADVEERVYAFARTALGELTRAGWTGTLAGIGDSVEDFGLVCHSTNSARHIRHVMMAKATGENARIVSSKDLQEDATACNVLEVHPLFETMQYADVDDVETLLTEYAASLGGADIHSSVTADYLHMEALVTSTRIVREAGGDPTAELDLRGYEGRLLSGRNEVENDLPAAAALLRQAIAYRDRSTGGPSGTPIAMARAYLAQHFTSPELMLQDVSAYVNMSNSRFSTVFVQKTGMTFTEYLTALRMSKAKELLAATDMRSSQIGQAVGYNDPHYFSYLFKKHVGMTPSDYRRKENQPK